MIQHNTDVDAEDIDPSIYNEADVADVLPLMERPEDEPGWLDIAIGHYLTPEQREKYDQ